MRIVLAYRLVTGDFEGIICGIGNPGHTSSLAVYRTGRPGIKIIFSQNIVVTFTLALNSFKRAVFYHFSIQAAICRKIDIFKKQTNHVWCNFVCCLIRKYKCVFFHLKISHRA